MDCSLAHSYDTCQKQGYKGKGESLAADNTAGKVRGQVPVSMWDATALDEMFFL